MKYFGHFKQNKIKLTCLKNAIRCKKSPRKFIGLPTINISTDSFFFNFLSPPRKSMSLHLHVVMATVVPRKFKEPCLGFQASPSLHKLLLQRLIPMLRTVKNIGEKYESFKSYSTCSPFLCIFSSRYSTIGLWSVS
jgi:hypothetical protein